MKNQKEKEEKLKLKRKKKRKKKLTIFHYNRSAERQLSSIGRGGGAKKNTEVCLKIECISRQQKIGREIKNLSVRDLKTLIFEPNF